MGLDDLTKKVENDFSNTLWTGSFQDFLKKVEEDPQKYVRASFQYLHDMIIHFGKYEVEDCGDKLASYKIFDDPFDSGVHRVFGLERPLVKLVSEIRTIAENNTDERILILHGPVATAKDTIVSLLFKGLEEYSKTGEGALYTFSWIFVADSMISKPGFKISGSQQNEDSYAYRDQDKVLSEIQCQLRDNPLFLVPKKYRKEYLEEIIAKSGKKATIPKKIIEGELCFNCQSIQTSLLKKYGGDWKKVLKHVKVDRLILSQNEQRGIATVDASNNPEGSAPVIVWDKEEYSAIEYLLRGIELHKYSGKWAKANRGIINFNEIFKHYPDFLQSLGMAVQEFKVDFNGIQGSTDCVIIGSTNLQEAEDFKAEPFNANLKDRMRITDIPYLLKVSAEKKLYERELKNAGYKTKKESADDLHITPNTLDILAYWCVMTRVKQTGNKQAEITRAALVSNMMLHSLIMLYSNPLLKVKFYNGEKLEGEEFILFNNNKDMQSMVRNEYPDEGLSGISFRTIQNILSDIISKKKLDKKDPHGCLNTLDVFTKIDEILDGKPGSSINYESADLGNNDLEKGLEYLREEYHLRLAREVKLAILCMDDSVVEKKVEDYVNQVASYIFKEKVENKITKKFVEPNEEMMRWVEEKLNVKEADKGEYRRKIVDKIASVTIRNDFGEEIEKEEYLAVIKKDLKEKIKDGLCEEKKGSLGISFEQLETFVKKFGTKEFDSLDVKYKKIVNDITGYMNSKFDYCDKCAKQSLLYALNERLIG